MTTLHS